MKKGFTLIELLVASLLLGMLVTVLTMIFNQSSVAWRTGTSSVVVMNQTRSAIGTLEDMRDDLLPGLGETTAQGAKPWSGSLKYRVVSVWKQGEQNKLRTASDRGFNYTEGLEWGDATAFSVSDAQKASEIGVSGMAKGLQDSDNYTVGIRSLGPDGLEGTDDINTWPEEIE